MICQHCGRNYSSRNYRSKYCKDPECVNERNRLRTEKHTCPICGTVFIAGRRKAYCSKECRIKGNLQVREKNGTRAKK